MPGVPASAVDNRDVPDPRQLYHKWHATTPVVTRAIVTLLAVISVSNTLPLSSLCALALFSHYCLGMNPLHCLDSIETVREMRPIDI